MRSDKMATFFVIFLVISSICIVLRFYSISGDFKWMSSYSIIVTDWDELSKRAAFFEGFVGPFLSFLTFLGVLYTVYMQRIELSEAKRQADIQSHELKIQSFESVFFNALKIHNDIVNSIDIRHSSGVTLKGRDCFRFFYNKLFDIYKARSKSSPVQNSPRNSDLDLYNDCFRIFWDSYRQDLGYYFRYIYNQIRFIDEFKFDCPIYNEKEYLFNFKMKYIRILRAQLSDYELALLLISSLGPHGNDLKKYLSCYRILDNLPDDLYIIQSHRDMAEEEQLISTRR